MELSILIARITSVLYLSMSLGAFFNADYFGRLAEDMYKNAAMTCLGGLMAVILGFLIVSHHNVWRKDWTVLITIIGWLALVKGVLILAFPRSMQRLSEPFLTGGGLRVFPYVTLALGLLFAYFGFARRRA